MLPLATYDTLAGVVNEHEAPEIVQLYVVLAGTAQCERTHVAPAFAVVAKVPLLQAKAAVPVKGAPLSVAERFVP